LEGYEYAYEGQVNERIPDDKAAYMIEHAWSLLNAPYLWGGRNAMGIDCSGFTQLVARIAGIKLHRDAYQQAEQGTTLGFIEEARAGDLAFFDNDEGRIIHVGLLLNNTQIIHASGKVRVDKIDHEGIFNAEVGCEFVEKILSRGNSADPLELFRDFMGRDPEIAALLKRSGLAAA
jgi:hypothetical protein